jgi:hypothetical protein
LRDLSPTPSPQERGAGLLWAGALAMTLILFNLYQQNEKNFFNTFIVSGYIVYRMQR